MWCSLHGRHGHGHGHCNDHCHGHATATPQQGTTKRVLQCSTPPLLSLLSSLIPGGEEELLGPGGGGEVGRRVNEPELARGEHAFGVAIVGPWGGVVWKEGEKEKVIRRGIRPGIGSGRSAGTWEGRRGRRGGGSKWREERKGCKVMCLVGRGCRDVDGGRGWGGYRKRILLKRSFIGRTRFPHEPLSLGMSTCASASSSSSGCVRVCVRIRVCVWVYACVHGAGRRRGIPGDVL